MAFGLAKHHVLRTRHDIQIQLSIISILYNSKMRRHIRYT